MRGLLSTAVMATGASAIMIPPNVALNQEGAFNIAIPKSESPVQSFGVNPYTQLVKLPCPGCPIAHFGERGVSWSKTEENYLILNISVSANNNRLDLNGAQFYPPPEGITREPEVLQVPADMSVGDIQTMLRVAGPIRPLRVSTWSVYAGAVHQTGNGGEEVLKMHIQIEALENYPVDIPEVEVTAIKTSQAGILIINAHASTKSRQAGLQECGGWPLLCQWRQMVAAQLQTLQSKVRGACHKMRIGAANMHKTLRPHHHERPRPHVQHKKPEHAEHKSVHAMHHKKPHAMHHKKPQNSQDKKPHHHGEHHHAPTVHKALHKVARILLTIVIPILFGVLAGMITYLLGMFVGTGIAMAWRAIHARRKRYSRIQLDDSDDCEEGEEVSVYSKEGFVDQEIYPHYIEIEGSEVRQQ